MASLSLSPPHLDLLPLRLRNYRGCAVQVANTTGTPGGVPAKLKKLGIVNQQQVLSDLYGYDYLVSVLVTIARILRVVLDLTST